MSSWPAWVREAVFERSIYVFITHHCYLNTVKLPGCTLRLKICSQSCVCKRFKPGGRGIKFMFKEDKAYRKGLHCGNQTLIWKAKPKQVLRTKHCLSACPSVCRCKNKAIIRKYEFKCKDPGLLKFQTYHINSPGLKLCCFVSHLLTVGLDSLPYLLGDRISIHILCHHCFLLLTVEAKTPYQNSCFRSLIT